MDKRTLFFVIGLSVLFFMVHEWFGSSRPSGIATPPSAPTTHVEILGGGKASPIPQNQFGKYQIVKLYQDVDLKNFATLGLEQEENVVVFSWQKDMPKELYTKSIREQVPVTNRILLHGKPSHAGDPVLYSIFSRAQFKVPFIPHEGKYNIAAVYFEGDKAYKIEGKSFSTEKIVLDEKPSTNSFLLFEEQGNHSPYAVYDPSNDEISYLDRLSQFQAASVLTFPEAENLQNEFRNQEFYVIENEYQQLVFTNINGALAEINLPFYSPEHPNSVVREVEFDRVLQKDYSFNDHFPQSSYLTYDGKEKQRPALGGYYPLLRRNLIGKAGRAPSTQIDPHYYALAIMEDEETPTPQNYKLKRFEKDLIEFELIEGNRKITKTYSFPPNPSKAPYCINLSVRVDGDARGLQLTTGVPEVELISGSFSPALKYKVTRNQKSKVEEISTPKELTSFSHIYPDWICNGNGFFGIITTPLTKSGPGFTAVPIDGTLTPTRLSVIDAQYKRFPAGDYPGYDMRIPLLSKPGVSEFRIFAGPFDHNVLTVLDQTFSAPEKGYFPDYEEAQSYHGWFAFISQPFAKFLFILMSFFHKVTHSWGFSIILLTLALRIMLYPLNSWSLKSTVKMQQIAPKVTALQEKYKKDPKRAQLEIMTLYRKEGVNPFGGCLPLLIQLPFLFGMFDLLKSSFDLRGASFIPGWIDDLTAPDVVFSWKYPIIFFGNSFHLLPILLGVIMYFQQKFTSSAKTTTGPLTDQQKQQKFMGNIMTLVFTVLFYHFQSGLNIYWISSMLLGILQQWWISKRLAMKNTNVEKI